MLLLNTTAAAASIQEQFSWRGYARQARAEGVASLVPLTLDEVLAGVTRVNNPELVSLITAVINAGSVKAAVGGGRALATRPDYTALLAQITVPALILVGIEDTVTPLELAEDLDQGIPQSALLVIDAASHLSFLEQPEEANQAIADWASQAVPANLPR